MHIFVDESGTFVHTDELNSWSTIVAFAIPDRQIPKLEQLIANLRAEVRGGEEVKLKHLTEARYIRFLRDLSRLGGLAFAAAGDASRMPPDLVSHHREMQSKSVVMHIDKMQHQSMRDSLTKLSETISTMSLQLYTQMQLQLTLFDKLVRRSSMYFAQHDPAALEFFRWRLDQKDVKQSEYERVFELVLAPVMQSMSITDPFIMVNDAKFDYSYFARFDFPPGEQPTYLYTEYDIEPADGFNAKKLLTEDFALVNSDASPGVQAADLLASGIRKLLRGGFTRSHEIALLIGANMVTGMKGESLISLLSLGTAGVVDAATAKIIRTIDTQGKPLLGAR